MPRVKYRGVVQTHQPVGQTVVHRLRTAVGQVHTSTGANEQSIPGDEPLLYQKTLRTGCMARRVQQHYLDVTAQIDHLVALGRHLGGRGDLLEDMCLSLMHVHWHVDQFQQLDHSWNVVAKEFAASVVLMRMGDEHLADRVAILLGRLYDALNIPGWINDRRLARGRIANEIDIILHWPTFHLLQIERLCHRRALLWHTSNRAPRSRCVSPIIRYFCCPVCHKPMLGKSLRKGKG